MSLALCAPQSSRFSLSFALRKLFANLGTLFIIKRLSVWDSHTQKEIHDIQILGIQFIIEYQGM